ncbi:MAG: metal-dependent phosphohydrolase [Deltaproteobacteria bacterium HGW-Deltaproteobacteria-8]|nr:MAG: metal-dependent phosphohydrolase [Deltaproteobacteria bacterium HGW-Deltaproteobacteria-8]
MSIRLFDFLTGLSGALDLISPEVVGHHKRVAYAAVRLARVLDLPRAERTDLYVAGLLHDVGGFSIQSRLAALQFEADGVRHAERGFRLLRKNPLLEGVAVIVRHHHTPFARFGLLPPDQDGPPRKLFLANVLCLADRLDVLFVCREGRQGNMSPTEIERVLKSFSGTLFDPAFVPALVELAADERFWADMATTDPTAALTGSADMFDERGMTRAQLMDASQAFSQIIDFRSRFTATHTRGVAEAAVCLAEKARFNAADLDQMRLAGNLHDLGKLAVPSEIINKPGPLSAQERDIMRRHPELGHAILSSVPGLEQVTDWASQHHEQPNGEGYPGGVSGRELSLGSRILAVADVFTALREDRPYRAGMGRADTLRILDDMAADNALDPLVASLVHAHHAELNDRRLAAQTLAAEEFREFYTGLEQ